MNVKPLYDRVIVKRDEAEQTTSGGIILTNDIKKASTRGVVIAVGDGRLIKDGELRPLEVKVGDKVLFADEIEQVNVIDDVEYVIMKEQNIMGVVIE